MKRLQQNYHILPVEKSDLAEVTDLFTTYLNGGEPVVRHLREAFETPGYIGVKCMDGKTTAGVFTAIPGIDFTYPHQELEQRIRNRWTGRQFYSMDMILVQPRYQGQGIARELASHLRRRLLEAGAGILIIEMWDPLGKGDRLVDGIIRYFGDCLEIWDCPGFYSELYDRGMTCPECGDGPCRCGAGIGIVDLFGSGGGV